MKSYIFMLVSMVTPFLLHAQRNISGSVLSGIDREPLPGASVNIKNTDKGTITNLDGKFLLALPEGAQILVISFIGFQTREILVPEMLSDPLIITLNGAPTRLDQVIVSTGYYHIPKERATGSFDYIDNDLLNRTVSVDILSRLEGVASGLLFDKSSYQEPQLNIRGKSTIFANDQPLIVLDNFPYEGDIETINPNDIASVTVLKDAAAASIWGVRSGNGVIVITTKKGRPGQKPLIEFNSSLSVGEKPDLFYFPMISSSDYVELEKQLFARGFYEDDETDDRFFPPLTPAVETMIAYRDGLITLEEMEATLNRFSTHEVRNDLQKYFYRNSMSQQYALNLRGGTPRFTYYLSAGYDKERKSKMENQDDRFTFRSVSSLSLLDNLDLTGEIIYTNTAKKQNHPGIGALTQLGGGKTIYPYARLVDEQGKPATIVRDYRRHFVDLAESSGLLDWEYRPLEDLHLSDNRRKQTHTRINTALHYRIRESINVDLRYQYEKAFTNSRNLMNQRIYTVRDLINRYTSVNDNSTLTRNIPMGDIMDLSENEMTAHTGRLQINYQKNWSAKHDLAVLTGIELKEVGMEGKAQRVYGYDDNVLTVSSVDYLSRYGVYPSQLQNPIPDPRSFSSRLDRFLSYYANASYSFDNRYTISASARADQSNLFGVKANQRTVPLWSVGAAWNINREAFFTSDLLDQLKLRFTYGFNGNLDKGVTAFVTASYRTNRLTQMLEATILNPANPNLRWERVNMMNIGLDFAIGEQIIAGSLEYYRKKGMDLIGVGTLAPSSGMTRFKGNVADIKGQGIDVTLRTQNLDGDFKWHTDALFSYAMERVSNYKIESHPLYYAQVAEGTPQSTDPTPMEGKPVYSLFSFRWGGLNPENGNPRGYVNGKLSEDYQSILYYETSAEDLIYHGPAVPPFFGSLRNSFSWKNFTVSANITYKLGHYFRKSSIRYRSLFQSWQGHSDFDLRWKQPGDEKLTNVPSMPELTNSARASFYTYSSALVEDASHIRLQDISFSYRFPDNNGFRRLFKEVTIYGYLSNLGILWKANKSGVDPDYVPVGRFTSFLPPARTFSLGLRMSL